MGGGGGKQKEWCEKKQKKITKKWNGTQTQINNKKYKIN